MRVAFAVDDTGERVPSPLKIADFINPLLVAQAELVPERAAGLHPVIPWHVVEPHQQVLWAGFEVALDGGQFGGVLLKGIGAAGAARGAEAPVVGLVIVG